MYSCIKVIFFMYTGCDMYANGFNEVHHEMVLLSSLLTDMEKNHPSPSWFLIGNWEGREV